MSNLEREVKPKEVFPDRRAIWGFRRVSLRSILNEVPVIFSGVDPCEEPSSQSESLLVRQYIVEHARPTTSAASEYVDRVQESLIIKKEKNK